MKRISPASRAVYLNTWMRRARGSRRFAVENRSPRPQVSVMRCNTRQQTKSLLKGLSCLLIATALAVQSIACPLCSAPSQTWAEMLTEADVVLLGQLISNNEGSPQTAPFSLVKVIQVHKGEKLLPADKLVRIEEYIFAEQGNLVLLKGRLQDSNAPEFTDTFANEFPAKTIQKVSATEAPESAKKVLKWDFHEQCTQAGFEYVIAAPPLDKDASTRLKYFIPYLEHSDPLVATDAWGEFANAEYKDIKRTSESFSAANLRNWIADPDAEPERRGLYGLMLGMCGTPADAEFLRQQIGQPDPKALRFGTEGLMGGLLVLSPVKGLQFLESSRLNNEKATAFDLFPVIKALQFAWTYESESFEKERLRSALRPLLKREELREIVIPDLSRWEDWNAALLMSDVYQASRADDPRTVHAIANFLVLCKQSTPEGTERMENAVVASELLEVIRKDNARLVQMAETEFAE
jgi:hypothetical protein